MAADRSAGEPEALRIDKLLWSLRLMKSRTLARRSVEQGHMRLNGRRLTSGHALVRPGDVLTLPWGRASRSIRITRLPVRRGPAAEARALYEDIGATRAAAAKRNAAVDGGESRQ